MELPTLYLNTSNGKKRYWKIWIEKNESVYILREYGIIGGKITYQKPKLIKHSGTISSFEKAKTEIMAQWRKKKELGFSEETNNKLHIKKSNVIRPMGAHKLNDHYLKIKYPAYVQTKLDGFRCLSHIQNNKAILFSKSMKQFVFLNHIKKEIEEIKSMLSNSNIYLDGELYSHSLDLHQISSLVMKKYANNEDIEKMKQIEYWIFDCFSIEHLSTETFEIRYQKLEEIFKKYGKNWKYLKIVPCVTVSNYQEILNLDTQFLLDGYEGVIVRNKNGIYRLNYKSYDVLRTKEFKKGLFTIHSAKEGSYGGIIWNIECQKNSNKNFWAIQQGTFQERVDLYNDFKKNQLKYKGKKVQIKYLGIDKNNGCVMRNPIVEKIFL